MILSLLLSAAALAFTPPSPAELHDLYFTSPASAHGPRLFVFCRHSRNFPCLMALKDRFDQPVRTADGSLWTLPTLALSMWNLPFSHGGGDTPQGVLRMNGVVPEPSVPENYGRFRRVILDFVPASHGEAELRRWLPAASQNSLWWRESVIARDNGRGGLRIHGNGGTGADPKTPYFPLVSSAGCVTTREGLYNGVQYRDQRVLLDELMRAQGLAPVYANETAIGGLLYLIEIDDRASAVTATDLAGYGIR